MDTHGVYFSANDAVLDWALPFLRSFRTFNPELRLILIPFDDHCDGLIKLQNQFNFEIYQDESFAELERIGQRLELGHSSYGPYWFRRYASFWGPLESFLYLDVRQIILCDLTEFVLAPQKYGLDLVHYDTNINQVYNEGELRTDLLKRGLARGFLSGLWSSKKHLFSLEEFVARADECVDIRGQLNLRNTDQFFINYCCDMRSINYAHWAGLKSDIVWESWAGQLGECYFDKDAQCYKIWNYGGHNHLKRVVLMHWAGYPLESWVPHYRHLKTFGLKTKFSKPLSDLPGRLLRSIKANRHLNQFCKSFKEPR